MNIKLELLKNHIIDRIIYNFEDFEIDARQIVDFEAHHIDCGSRHDFG